MCGRVKGMCLLVSRRSSLFFSPSPQHTDNPDCVHGLVYTSLPCISSNNNAGGNGDNSSPPGESGSAKDFPVAALGKEGDRGTETEKEKDARESQG